MDMQAYRTLHGNIRAAFRKLFMKDGLPVLYPKFDGLSSNRRVIGQTQTAIVLILHFGLYEGKTAVVWQPVSSARRTCSMS